MRTIAVFISLSLLITLFSCSNKPDNGINEMVVSQIDDAIEQYARSKLIDAKKTVDAQGNILIADDKRSYVFSAKRAVFGKIDGDDQEDAVVPVKLFTDKIYLISDEIFVVLKTGENYKVVASTNKILKIKEVKDGIITLDYTEIPIDAPNYGCKECTDEINFKLEGDSLVRIQ